MPISDEIIELEPVKKSKIKLIIMFVIMGVLLALAVTFLIMYVLKPNVEPDDGKVPGVSSTSTALFSTTDENGEPVLTASVGTEYTVYANVTVDGDVNSEVLWTWDPVNAIREVDHGAVEEAAQAASDGSSTSRASSEKYYFTFYPVDGVAANTPVTITARSVKDASAKTEIKFYIVKQGTENINFRSMYHLQNVSDIKDIDANTSSLELPFYSRSGANNTYNIQLEQLGKYDSASGTYSKLTVSDDGNGGNKTNKLDVVSSNESLVKIDRVTHSEMTGRDTFSFIIQSTGTSSNNRATITITANNYNDFAEPYTKTIDIIVRSPSELGYVDEIRIYDQPVASDFYTQYKDSVYGKIPVSSKVITMPYRTSTAKFTDHIVLLPLSIQYNSDGTRKDASEWISKINIASSNESILTTSGSGATKVFTANKLAGITTDKKGDITGGECSLVVRDVASGGEISANIFVNIIAQNVTGSPRATTADKTYTASQKDGAGVIMLTDKVSTSPEIENTFSVTYSFLAPPETDKEDLLSTKRYVTKTFSVNIPEGATVKYCGEKLVSDRVYSFTDMTVTADNAASGRYSGRLDFTVSFDKNFHDECKIVFRKIGTELGSIGQSLDATWSVGANFKVTPLMTSASFISDAEGTALVTENGVRAGKFTVDPQDRTTANLYIQNRAKDTVFPFAFNRLVYGYGDEGYDITATATLNVLGNVLNNGLDSVGRASFAGIYTNDGTRAGEVTLNVRNSVNSNIGTLKVNIYVIDELAEARLYDSPNSGANRVDNVVREVNYGSKHSGLAAVEVESVAVYGKFKTASASSDTPIERDYDVKNNVMLAYYDGNTYIDFDTTPSGNVTEFKHNGNTIYKYDSSSKRLSMEANVFEYGYKNNIDLSVVRVRFTTQPYAYSGTTVSVNRIYNFIVDADEYGVFTNSEYTARITGGSHTVNQGDMVNLYSSPIINVAGISDPVVVGNARQSGKTVAKCEQSYFVLPTAIVNNNGIAINGVKYDNSDNNYITASFRAPNAVNSTGDTYTVTVPDSKNTFTLKVTNQARKIESNGIAFYSNENCTDPLNKLDFGIYSSSPTGARDSYYEATIYIKITYETYDSTKNFTKFEEIELLLPSSLEIKSMQFKGEGAGCALDVDNRVAPNKDNAQAAETVKILICNVKLKATAADSLTDSIKASNTLDSRNEKQLPVTVGSALSDIKFTADNLNFNTGNAASPAPLTFVFSDYDSIGKKFIDIDLAYENYSVGDGYGNIKYNAKNLSVSSNIPTNSCVKFTSDLTDSNRPHITFAITLADFKKLDNYPVTLTFTDTSSGTAATFTVNFVITVKLEVYDVKLSGNVVKIVTTGKVLDGIDPPNIESGDADTYKYWSDGVVVKPIYNGSDSDATFAPNEEFLQFLSARIEIKKADGTYVRYSSDDFATDVVVVYNRVGNGIDGLMDGTFTVYVSNNRVTNIGDLYLHVWYRVGNDPDDVGGSTDAEDSKNSLESRVPITIGTNSNGLRIKTPQDKPDGVDVPVGDDVTVNVAGKGSQFMFAAEVYNLSSKDVMDKEKSKIVYSLYSDPARSNLIYSSASGASNPSDPVATINAEGIVKFVNPLTRNDTIYYRASYLDESSGNVRTLDRSITYRININRVQITAGQYTFDGSRFTLYYLDANRHTRITNLRQFFELYTDFPNAAVVGNGWNFTIETDSDIVAVESGVNGGVGSLTPRGIGETDIVVKFTGIYGGTVIQNFHIEVVALGGDIDITSDEGVNTIDILTNAPLNITATVNELKGIDATVEIVGETGLTVGALTSVAADADPAVPTRKSVGAPVTLNRNIYRHDSDYGKAKTITVRVTYTSKSDAKSQLFASSGGNTVVFEKTFTVTPVNNFGDGFDFDIIKGSDTKIGDSETIDNSAAYSVKLGKTHWDSDYSSVVADGISYNVAVNNNIISLPNSGKVAAGQDTLGFSFGANASGAVTVTVTAKVYGKTFGAVSKNYTFTRGESASAKMSYNANSGNGSYTDFVFNNGKATLDIGHNVATNPYRFKYRIDASRVGVDVTADDISIDYIGDVTVVSALAEVGTDMFEIVFRADKATTLIVGGSVKVNNKTYYTEKYELALTAVAPAFGLDYTMSGAYDNVKPCDVLTFNVSNTATDFKGQIGVTYAVESGGEYASFGNSVSARNILTVASSVTEDKKVIVSATVTVSGGVYNGKEYKLYKEITIHGVALPTAKWSDSVLAVADNKIYLNHHAVVEENGNTVITAYSVDDTNFTSDDYSLVNGVLTVKDTAKTRGGGRIRVKLTVTVNGNINQGKVATAYAYVTWTAFSYDVTFELNGGSIGNSTANVTENQTYGSNYILPENPVKTGYTFVGWFDGDDKQVTAQTQVELSDKQTLTAKWDANVYNVTLVSFDRSSTVEATYGGTYVFGSDPNRTGYRFDGWYTAQTGGDEVTNGSTVDITSDTTLYAQFTANEYTVTVNGNGKGSPTKNPQTFKVPYGSHYDLGSAIDESGKYVFTGWHYGDDTKIAANGIWEIDRDKLMIYADWTEAKYTVTLNANGGTLAGNTVSIVVTWSLKYFNLSSVTNPTRNGYEFGGWYTDPTGGSEVTANTELTKISDHSIYAHWTPQGNSEITLDYKYGGNTQTITASRGDKYSTLPALTRPGYIFGGWYTDGAASDSSKVTNGMTIAFTWNVATRKYEPTYKTLYAKWILASFTVILDAQGGTCGTVSITVEYGGAYSDLDGVTPTRMGYRFDGWFFEKNGGTAIVASGENATKVEITADRVIYAQWTIEEYNITFIDKGNAVDGKFKYDADLPTPTKDGHTFGGWYREAACTTPVGNTVPDLGESGAAVTLYGKWTAIQYTLTLDANGGSIFGDETFEFTVVYDGTLAIGGMIPTHEGKAFGGWYLSTDADKTVVSTVTVKGDAVYEAKWTDEQYNISFNGDHADSVLAYSATLPTPTKVGHTFGGWYREAACTTAVGTTVPDLGENGAAVTLYAKWTANTYTITLNGNKPDGVSDEITGIPEGGSITVTYGESYSLPTLTLSGYAFEGWFTDEDCLDGNKFDMSGGITENIQLYAKWTEATTEPPATPGT